jgi:hypothetical protein
MHLRPVWKRRYYNDRLRGERLRFNSNMCKRFFSTPQRPDRFWAHLANYPIGIEEGGTSPVIKRPGREVDDQLNLVPRLRTM